MKLSKFIVLSNPIEGKEPEYNEWYDGQHIPDVLNVAGVVSAQRFRIAGVALPGEPIYQYMAIYDIESDTPQEVLDIILELSGTDAMPMGDIDPAMYAVAYEPTMAVRIDTK